MLSRSSTQSCTRHCPPSAPGEASLPLIPKPLPYCRYVQLQCRRLADQQAAIAAQLAELRQRQVTGGAGPCGNGAAPAAPACGRRQSKRPPWLDRRAAAGAAAAAALLGGSHPLVRLARLLPLLLLLDLEC